MRLPARKPPSLGHGLSWRELWRSGAFAQHDLTWDSNFASKAKERELRLGIGQGPLEDMDLQGAFQPIAFADGGNPPDFVDLSPYEERMTFREEREPAKWSAYAWEPDGHPHTSALYSPWQMLYVDDVLLGSGVELSAKTLLADSREATLDKWRGLFERHLADWQGIDEVWRPLIKLLVRVQNRYLPEITRRTVLLYDTAAGESVDPWPGERERFNAQSAASELELTAEQLAAAYWFLVERGIDREPRDGLELARRARPRSSHKKWRGLPRRAQDHFDAAELLRRFYLDLTVELPARNPSWLLDGRQVERGALYDRGPAATVSRAQLQDDLVAAGLYPHAVHLVGEGRSERDMVTELVAGLLGGQWADEVGFTDLGGSGSASRLPTMVGGFTSYAQRTVVVVDSEGEMAQYAKGLTRSGELDEDDLMLFDDSLEESNFALREMLEVLVERAAAPPPGQLAVELSLRAEDVASAHERRRQNARVDPGIAGTLLKEAEDPAYGGPVTVGKPEFARLLARRMLDELDAAHGDNGAIEALRERRPVLRFVLDRVLPVLMGPRWH